MPIQTLPVKDEMTLTFGSQATNMLLRLGFTGQWDPLPQQRKQLEIEIVWIWTRSIRN